MAILQQDENSSLFYEGWYGACSGLTILSENEVQDSCEDFPIVENQNGTWARTQPQIDKIWIINEENLGTRIYDSNTFDFLLVSSQVKKLECGKYYRIKLKKLKDGTIDIPHFVTANAKSLDEHRIIKKESC